MSYTPAPESINIERREMAFRFDVAIPRYWAKNNPVITAFYNALSTVIPSGEKFFIRTVKQSMAGIDDPQLQKEVAGFMAQEAQHTLGHRAMNNWIRDKGYPVEAIEKSVQGMLAFVGRHYSAKYQLALTVALEHFSCLLSDQFLRQKKVQAGLQADMCEFLIAHCVEENEHKAVAFDVYQSAYGDYLPRVLMMLFVATVFAPNVFRIQFIYLLHEKQLFKLHHWLDAIHYFWLSPAWFTRTIPGFLDFFRVGFHPWQNDNSPLLQEYTCQTDTGNAGRPSTQLT